jgi:hypothetical protein
VKQDDLFQLSIYLFKERVNIRMYFMLASELGYFTETTKNGVLLDDETKTNTNGDFIES